MKVEKIDIKREIIDIPHKAMLVRDLEKQEWRIRKYIRSLSWWRRLFNKF